MPGFLLFDLVEGCGSLREERGAGDENPALDWSTVVYPEDVFGPAAGECSGRSNVGRNMELLIPSSCVARRLQMSQCGPYSLVLRRGENLYGLLALGHIRMNVEQGRSLREFEVEKTKGRSKDVQRGGPCRCHNAGCRKADLFELNVLLCFVPPRLR